MLSIGEKACFSPSVDEPPILLSIVRKRMSINALRISLSSSLINLRRKIIYVTY